MGALYLATGLCLRDLGLQRHGSNYMAPVRVARDSPRARSDSSQIQTWRPEPTE